MTHFKRGVKPRFYKLQDNWMSDYFKNEELQLSSKELLLFLAIVHRTNYDGNCYQSNKALSKLTGITTKNLGRYISGLSDKGYIRIFGKGHDRVLRVCELIVSVGKATIDATHLCDPDP